ncbi:unnamed protein product [Cuscuta campestris]|uniref:Uncharacterized protein n=1 Tax=Cuscuta campestris TaxID=132261 RepID=A0A484MXM3_9ASTE|nr:unnamed protein product [Cuscuta campestris]
MVYPAAFGYRQQAQPYEKQEDYYYSYNDSTSMQLVHPRPHFNPVDDTNHEYFISAPQHHVTAVSAGGGGGGYPVPQHGGGHYELNPKDACGKKYASGSHHYYGGTEQCHDGGDYDDDNRHHYGGKPYYSMRKLPFVPESHEIHYHKFMSGGSGGGSYGFDETTVDGFARPAAAFMEGPMRRPKFDFAEKKVDRWELKSID